MVNSFTNFIHVHTKQIVNVIAPTVLTIVQTAPQFMLIDFKMQKIYFGSMAVLQGSLGLIQSHVTDKMLSYFINRQIKPIQYDLAATSVILIAGGTFLICDALSEFHGIYNKQITNQLYFAEEHKNELAQLCQQKTEIKEWKELNRGIHKIVFIHPQLPGYVVKIPGINDPDSVNRLKDHFKNAQIARDTVKNNQYNHLVIPDTHLLGTPLCPIVIEEKFEFMSIQKYDVNLPKTAAESELKDFLRASGIEDVIFEYCGEMNGIKYCGHNARFIKDTDDDPKIAVFDLDRKK